MKKLLIIIGILVVILIGFLIFRPSPPEAEDLNTNTSAPIAGPKPSDITVGLFDPSPEPSELTRLLDSRLKEVGFKTIITNELVDPEAANQEMATLLFRASTKEALAVVGREIIISPVYRKGQNEAILQDIIVSSWNIEDIKWGSLADAAEKYKNPNPATVSVVVLNAGAESGAAGKLAELLQKEGYSQAQAQNTESEETAAGILIYHQRNYKNVAKNLQKLLTDNSYSDVTYRLRLDQPANLVIILGAEKPVEIAPVTE